MQKTYRQSETNELVLLFNEDELKELARAWEFWQNRKDKCWCAKMLRKGCFDE